MTAPKWHQLRVPGRRTISGLICPEPDGAVVHTAGAPGIRHPLRPWNVAMQREAL